MTRDFVYIDELGDHVDQVVTIKGWISQKRSSGRIKFLVVRDGSGYLQCVAFVKDVSPELFETVDAAPIESSVAVRGLVKKDDRAPGGYEMALQELTVIAESDDFPIQPKEHGPEFLFDQRHLYLRSRTPQAVLGVRNEVLMACRDFYYERGYVLIDAPILTPAACEGTTTLFETDYFGQTAYLAQSGQLYQEPACMAFGRVYCLGPTFRAEKSKTRRHLTEFWMCEPEVAFMELPALLELAEEFVSYIAARVLDRCKEQLKTLERDPAKLEAIVPPFPRLTYTEASKILLEPAMQARMDEAGAPRFTDGSDFGG
ncbi:MAG: OB-fold nucleic acid binding domain-containing protein, partial [Acidobacteriota bacterium]|nr:OB-fold nucleic acid binding domain-containing protein [Acidobacteriota bacterium]